MGNRKYKNFMCITFYKKKLMSNKQKQSGPPGTSWYSKSVFVFFFLYFHYLRIYNDWVYFCLKSNYYKVIKTLLIHIIDFLYSIQ